MSERSWTFHDGIRLVLLFHDPEPWGPAKVAEWKRITGRTEATTKVMCDHLHSLIDGGGGFAPGSQSAFGDRCMNLMTVGHTLTEKDVADITAMIYGNNEEIGEGQTAEQRGYMTAIRQFGGAELADAVAASDAAVMERMCDKAMERVRVMLARRREGLT